MKNSDVIFSAALMLPLSTYANKIVTVRGQGESTGYFELKDDWSLSHLKSQGKRAADKEARAKCAKLSGKPLVELASYTSTCKPQPRYSAMAGYWHKCLVTVLLDCEIQK